jgi:hypothetical protein
LRQDWEETGVGLLLPWCLILKIPVNPVQPAAVALFAEKNRMHGRVIHATGLK